MNYIKNICLKESDLMKSIREAIGKEDHTIHIEPEKGQLIKILLQMIKAEKVLEVGTHYGYSTLWLLEGVGEHGKIDTIERNDQRHARAKHFIGKIPQIQIHHGDALEVFDNLSGPYDAIFIDAEKIKYMDYLKWAETNLRKGGLLMADDTLLFGALEGKDVDVRPTTLEVMKDFNLALTKGSFESIILPYVDGFTIAVKN